MGGMTSVYVDLQAAMNHDYAVVFPVAAVVIMLILALLLRSLVAPWYLMASVGLGFGATLGATALLFQTCSGATAWSSSCRCTSTCSSWRSAPTTTSSWSPGCARRPARAGTRARPRPRRSQHGGPTVASAGLILAGTFASLMLGGNSLLVSMGFAIAFGIFVAAFVMALFFTPALTALIGHGAWWPGHGDEGREDGEGGEGAARPDGGQV